MGLVKVNNAQRKAFADIAISKYSEARAAIDTKNKAISRGLEFEVKKTLGIEMIDSSISKLNKQVEELQNKRRMLIGSTGYGGTEFAPGTKAYKMRDILLQQFDVDTRIARKMENATLTEVWGATTVKSAKAAIMKIDKVVDDQYKKLDKIMPLMMKEAKKLEIPNGDIEQ